MLAGGGSGLFVQRLPIVAAAAAAVGATTICAAAASSSVRLFGSYGGGKRGWSAEHHEPTRTLRVPELRVGAIKRGSSKLSRCPHRPVGRDPAPGGLPAEAAHSDVPSDGRQRTEDAMTGSTVLEEGPSSPPRPSTLRGRPQRPCDSPIDSPPSPPATVTPTITAAAAADHHDSSTARPAKEPSSCGYELPQNTPSLCVPGSTQQTFEPKTTMLSVDVSTGTTAAVEGTGTDEDMEDLFVAVVDGATVIHALWKRNRRKMERAFCTWRRLHAASRRAHRKLGRVQTPQTERVPLSAFMVKDKNSKDQTVVIPVARAADRGNILELLLKECEGRRVDPSDGQSYDYASFRSCYGADALRLWRRAGDLAQQQAKAERTRFRMKVRRSFGTHSANSDRVKQARRQECPYANPLSLEAKRWYQAQMAH